ncbi:low-molecular-weight cysteine-rich 68 [Actinidia rufa]|uniref:Low-molecular-weight cysteine-rich 68 n=1 Tax=Actinidia rufa TaxID=165716 RepID=A0A7J0EJR2_9ERIC|nr:low-molecular-weight cysteine-rich 68 [Actinidia rufa]
MPARTGQGSSRDPCLYQRRALHVIDAYTNAHTDTTTTAMIKGMMKQGEARVCESQSHGFKGACSGDHNCALVCRNEGFSGGHCRGFRHRCFCTKIC